MNTTTATAAQLPADIKATPSLTAVYTAVLAGAAGASKEIAEAAGVKLTSAKEALKVLTAHGITTVTPGSGIGKSSIPTTWALTVVETPKVEAPKAPKAATGGRKLVDEVLAVLSGHAGQPLTVREVMIDLGRDLKVDAHVRKTLKALGAEGRVKVDAAAKVKTFMYVAA